MKDKTAIITGATSGLGKAYALALAKMGWDLLITGRRVERLMGLTSELEKKYDVRVDCVEVDFNNQLQFDAFIQKIDAYKTIDLLINNAGYGCRDGFFNQDYEVQEDMLNVHVTAATHIVHKVVPKMLCNNGGAIINVSSLSAFIPAPLNYFYCSSKMFMVSFSECLHVDLEKSNIKVQALCPGFIETEFHSRIGVGEKSESILNKVMWMKPEQVVDYSLRALKAHRVICVPGMVNRLVYLLSSILPKQLCYWVVSKNTRANNQPKVCAA